MSTKPLSAEPSPSQNTSQSPSFGSSKGKSTGTALRTLKDKFSLSRPPQTKPQIKDEHQGRAERQHAGFSNEASIRIDIWLWQARFFKSRALCAKMVRSRRIRLFRGGVTVRLTKSHTKIRPSDVLVFMIGNQLVHIEIKHIGTRRGPAAEARTLYQVLESESATARELTTNGSAYARKEAARA